MQITIAGDCPSKKNSRAVSFKNGRFGLFPGKTYQKWHNEAMNQLFLLKEYPRIKVEQIDIVFYPETRRRSDLTNRAESVMDLLVDACILEDDNWYVCPRINLRFGEVDKANPRVEIEIL